MAPGVLVTRPMPQAEMTAAKLEALGYSVVLAPMLRIERISPPPPINLKDVQAILVTSRHGATALAAAVEQREIPILAVGDRTALAARECGFTDVRSAAGDAEALAAVAAEMLVAQEGAILHARGRDVARSPLPALTASGFEVSEAVLYSAVQAEALPEVAHQALVSGAIRAVLVYSARTGAALSAVLANVPTDGLIMIGLSEAALDPVSNLPGIARFAAPSPCETSLLNTLQARLPIP